MSCPTGACEIVRAGGTPVPAPKPRPERDPRPGRRQTNDEVLRKIDETLEQHGAKGQA